MQQEDDLRALAKIMEFGRAVSIFLLVVHVYVYCYPSITAWHLNLEVIDRILETFNNTTGIFQLYSLEQTCWQCFCWPFPVWVRTESKVKR